MGLVRVNTAYFEVVNTSDPDVSGVGERGNNEWVPISDVIAGEDATRVRVRALTRREFDAVPLSDDGKMLGALVDAGVHEADRPLISGTEPIPWHFQRSLGAFIYRVSTNPLAVTK
jgi:hypothetical protein